MICENCGTDGPAHEMQLVATNVAITTPGKFPYMRATWKTVCQQCAAKRKNLLAFWCLAGAIVLLGMITIASCSLR
jgi:hypothetical protein